ncbi:MAG: hypothetical protein R2838_04275 [Caldilineaceae bacterium]
MMYGEPQPTYVVFQNFANEGAKILAQLTHEADVLNLSTDGMKAVLSSATPARLPTRLALRREQRPRHHGHHLQHGARPV